MATTRTKIRTGLVAVVDESYRGDVEFVNEQGTTVVRVPIEALRNIVAESVRRDLLDHVLKMKPEGLLRRLA